MISRFATRPALREFLATHQAATPRDYLRDAGTEVLRFALQTDIADGRAVDAARHTRSLVRHMKATGLLTNEEPS